MFWVLIYCFIHLCWGLLLWIKYRCPSNIQFEILLSYIWFLICGVTRRRGRFFGIVLYFWWALDCTLIFFFLIFDKKFSYNQGIWALVYGEFVSVLAICVSYTQRSAAAKFATNLSFMYHPQPRWTFISFRTIPMLSLCYGKCKWAF